LVWFGVVDRAGDAFCEEEDQMASELTSVRSGKADVLKTIRDVVDLNHHREHGKNEQQVEAMSKALKRWLLSDAETPSHATA
jgi:hypothetical protein